MARFDDLPPDLDVPTLWCPIPPQTHPQAAGADERLLDWAIGFKLVRNEAAVQRFRKAGFGAFCAVTYPRAVGASGLDLMSEWNGYNWVLDDWLDEGHVTRTSEECVRICGEVMAQMPLDMHAPRPSSPLLAAIGDLWQRTARPMSAAWRQRYRAHYYDWLSGSLLPHIPSKRACGSPSLTAFVRRRRIHSGCELSFDLLEPGNRSEVPEEVTSCDVYESVRAAASDAIAATNDIYSLRKELARGDRDHLVPFLRDTEGLSWQEALFEAAALVEDWTRDFLLACDDLRVLRPLFTLDDEEWQRVEDSLTDLGYWLSGSLDWHTWSPRYRDVEITAAADQLPSYIEPHLV